MEEKKKTNILINAVVRPVVLAAVLVVAFLVSSGIMNRNNQGITSEMKECTFPTITAVYKDREINRMYGYADQMDPGTIRNGITLLDEAGKLPVLIQTYGTGVKAVSYQVRSLDGSRLIEETQVKDLQESDNQISAYLNIQDLLEEGRDYRLRIQLTTDSDQDIYYYTRIRRDGDFNASENLDFVLDFNEKTFTRTAGDEIIKYLESGSEGDNSSFHNVTIHSSYEMVTWGDLQLLDRRDMDITLSEINSQSAVINLSYLVVLKNSAEEEEHYNVSEYYRVRYTKDRMYLLDYERTMDQIFEIDNNVIYSTAVQLGITDADVEYRETKNGKSVSFVQEGELFAYNSSEHSMAKIFGFWNRNSDVRYRNQQHEIKLINVDEKGNTDFVVYGYMNRGIHEGKVGVSVCHYDSATNSTEEYAFLETNRSYEVLKNEVGQLLYLNEKGSFFINLQNNLYQIDLNTRKTKLLMENVESDRFAVSEDNTLLVMQKKELLESDELTYINLETGSQKKIACDAGERIRSVGFIGSDLVYGVARAEDTGTDGNGQCIFPMYKLVIENSKGEVKKTYEQSGIYVLGYEITDNVLRLSRASRTDSGYAQTSDDQIIHSAGKNENNIKVKTITTELKKKECQLEFGFSLSTAKKKCLQPMEVFLENVKNISLDHEQERTGYYVYIKGRMDNIYINAADAVKKADAGAGTVVTANQEYVYERAKRRSQWQISSVETVSTASGYTPQQACLVSLLHFAGSGEDPRPMLEQGMTSLAVLQQAYGADKVLNLTGVTLEQALYCVDRGYPVLAAVSGGSYVVLCGYNELNTIVMDPVKGTTGYVGMNDSRAMFEGAGNVFIACIP